jgi:hypothetical protein
MKHRNTDREQEAQQRGNTTEQRKETKEEMHIRKGEYNNKEMKENAT